MKKIRIRRCRNRDETTARMLAARDADHDHPMRDEEAVEGFGGGRRYSFDGTLWAKPFYALAHP